MYKRQGQGGLGQLFGAVAVQRDQAGLQGTGVKRVRGHCAVSYTHLRAHETVLDLVCRLLLEKKQHRN